MKNFGLGYGSKVAGLDRGFRLVRDAGIQRFARKFTARLAFYRHFHALTHALHSLSSARRYSAKDSRTWVRIGPAALRLRDCSGWRWRAKSIGEISNPKSHRAELKHY